MKDALDLLNPPPAAAPSGAGLRVLVSSYRSNPHVGGQGVYVRELTRALKAEGCEVTVISGSPYPVLDEGVALIELPSLDLFETDNAMLALRWRHLMDGADRHEWLAHNTGAFGEMTAFSIRLERFIREHGDRFDVIHDNQSLAMGMARIDQRLKPVVTTLHHPIHIDRDFAVAGAKNLTYRILARRWHSFVTVQAKAGRRLSRFLAVSAAARDAYAARCRINPARVSVAHNGIDHEAFRPDPSVQREPDLIAAMASADVPIKGLDVLIGALALIAPQRPDLRLEVVGSLRDGPTKRALEATGLADRVTFRSGLTREEIADLYRRAGVFVSASRFEGFGFPAAEAMACGAPVIVSDGGALPEVAGDAGIVTPVGDAQALARAIADVMDDETLRARMSAAGAARAASAFRWSLHAQAAIRLYREALGEAAVAEEMLA
jgi:glycosyltransferase involved in cell wall biosynthesis